MSDKNKIGQSDEQEDFLSLEDDERIPSRPDNRPGTKIHPINVPLPINQVPVPVLPAANRVSEGKPKRNSMSTILLRALLS